MHRVLVPPSLDLGSAIELRSKLRRARSSLHLRALSSRPGALLIFFSCSLLFILSGCGGVLISEGDSGALKASPNSVSFGAVAIGQTASTAVSLVNGGSAPVEITKLNLTGQPFSVVASSDFPVTISAGGTFSLNVQFSPAASGTATGQLTVASNASTNGTAVISLTGTGMATPPALSALSCISGAITGSGTDACTVTLSTAAPSGLNVNLSSSSSAVTVPNTVTVPVGATSAGFTATASAVETSQAVTMTASAGSTFTSFTLQLNAAILALSINATSVAFGDVLVNTPATQSVTMTSTGTVPVTINGAPLTGADFTVPGVDFPATLNPNQEATLNLEFDPTTTGPATGQLTIASNSSINGTAVIALTGIGSAAPVVAVAVAPTTASISTGASQQFAASVTGTSNTAVTWTVSGTGCSGTTCGTISSAGLYTAPAVVPSPATVTVTATSVSDPTKSSLASVTVLPPPGATYYLAPASAGGNDSNNGLSPSKPWLSPNHPVNCGDVIIAKPSVAYTYTNFYQTFGTVSCPAGNNVAWLTCATFDACKITDTGGAFNDSGMIVSASYWGIAGWEITTSLTSGECFEAIPNFSTPVQIHHIVFANDICNGAGLGGFGSGPYGGAGVDYIAIVGNIAYNTDQGNIFCNSGIGVLEPKQSDSMPGTHIYIAGNFSFENFEPNPCAGSTPTDGEGILLDTLNQYLYVGQIVVDNNIVIENSGRGIVDYENTGGSSNAAVYFRYNTAWGNNRNDSQNNFPYCGEIEISVASRTEAFRNLASTNSATGCNAQTIYGFSVDRGDVTDQVYNNFIYGIGGNDTVIYSSGSFAYGPNNTTGSSPAFINPVAPVAPSCGSYTNVPACMAGVIADFTPTNTAALGYGYQIPKSTQVYDPLFPQWLCNVNLPSGLVTMGCLSAP